MLEQQPWSSPLCEELRDVALKTPHAPIVPRDLDGMELNEAYLKIVFRDPKVEAYGRLFGRGTCKEPFCSGIFGWRKYLQSPIAVAGLGKNVAGVWNTKTRALEKEYPYTYNGWPAVLSRSGLFDDFLRCGIGEFDGDALWDAVNAIGDRHDAFVEPFKIGALIAVEIAYDDESLEPKTILRGRWWKGDFYLHPYRKADDGPWGKWVRLPPDNSQRLPGDSSKASPAVGLSLESSARPAAMRNGAQAKVDRMPGGASICPGKHDGTKSKKSAADRCLKWLIGEMEKSPQRRPMPKEKYCEQAQELFSGLSERSFIEAWSEAVKGTGSTWSKHGRPKSSR